MKDSHQMISDVLQRLALADLMEEDYYDSIDHGELVGLIVGLLCRQLHLNEAFTEKAVQAAYVHDIGKLRLSKKLYRRDKQALQIESMKYMRMHAQAGREMLKECGYHEDILNAVYHHHENYDGSGYPDNLKGIYIPLAARVLRVCDAYAAFVSDRPYRKAFDGNTAVEMMIDEYRSFDMGIFLEFLKLYHSEQFQAVDELSKQINAKQRYEKERKIQWQNP